MYQFKNILKSKMAWKDLLKKPYLSQKPQLTQGLATYAEDRDLELAFKNLRDLEDHCKKLYKEVRRHEECANGLHRLEKKMSSDITNSPLCREYEDAEDLRKMAEDYQVHCVTLNTTFYWRFRDLIYRDREQRHPRPGTILYENARNDVLKSQKNVKKFMQKIVEK